MPKTINLKLYYYDNDITITVTIIMPKTILMPKTINLKLYYYDNDITITVLFKWALISDLFSILMWYW